MSGSASARIVVVTASARSLPDLMYSTALAAILRVVQAKMPGCCAPSPRLWLCIFVDELAGAGSKRICCAFLDLGALPMLGGEVVGDDIAARFTQMVYLRRERTGSGEGQWSAQHRAALRLLAGGVEAAQHQLARFAVRPPEAQGKRPMAARLDDEVQALTTLLHHPNRVT